MSPAALARTTPPPYYAAGKANAEHVLAQQRGLCDGYEHYEVRIARVERAYGTPPDR